MYALINLKINTHQTCKTPSIRDKNRYILLEQSVGVSRVENVMDSTDEIKMINFELSENYINTAHRCIETDQFREVLFLSIINLWTYKQTREKH